MGAKAHRAMATARRAAYYKSLPAQTLTNKKRTLARQLRRFPEDKQAFQLYCERYGEASGKTMVTDRVTARSNRRMSRRLVSRKRNTPSVVN